MNFELQAIGILVTLQSFIIIQCVLLHHFGRIVESKLLVSMDYFGDSYFIPENCEIFLLCLENRVGVRLARPDVC